MEIREKFLGLHICWSLFSYSFTSHSHIFCIFQLCELYVVQVHHITVLPCKKQELLGLEILVLCSGPNGSYLFDSLTVISDWFFQFLCDFGHWFNPFYNKIYQKPEIIISLEIQNKKRVSKMNFWGNTKLITSFNMYWDF